MTSRGYKLEPVPIDPWSATPGAARCLDVWTEGCSAPGLSMVFSVAGPFHPAARGARGGFVLSRGSDARYPRRKAFDHGSLPPPAGADASRPDLDDNADPVGSDSRHNPRRPSRSMTMCSPVSRRACRCRPRPMCPLRWVAFPILRRLGAGGMGAVYAAYDELLIARSRSRSCTARGLAAWADDSAPSSRHAP